jgi:predicted adenine nucleotide alpha hydrolase (AANH) superfamily ATPase
MKENSLLLHCCCAPCSAAILEYLLVNGIRPVLFFFNPNIFPREEYEKRKMELQNYAQSLGLAFLDGDYSHGDWLVAVRGLEEQPERGLRCLQCFKIRLLATAHLAVEKGFTQIATTLGSSRWKNLDQIAEAGHWATSQAAGEVTFLAKNWRKEGLSERRNILLKANGFYNQSYCGCEFSMRNT